MKRKFNKAAPRASHPANVVECAKQGNLRALKRLVRNGADINERNADGYTPLIAAARYGHLRIAEYLIRKGASLDEITWTRRETALMLSVIHKKPDVALLLIRKGADIHIPNHLDITPIGFAAYYNLKTVARALLDKGADAHKKNHNGYSAFWYAQDKRHVEIEQMIKDAPALLQKREHDRKARKAAAIKKACSPALRKPIR